MPVTSSTLLALAQDRAPVFSAEELAGLPEQILGEARYVAEEARAVLDREAASLRGCLAALPVDAELIYWRIRRASDEVGTLAYALASEQERRETQEKERHG